VLLAGGAWLVGLGGSPYYVLAGVALVAVAGFVWRGRPAAGSYYAALLAISAVWALWESGFEPWALTARLFALATLGLAFALPGVRQRNAAFAGAAVIALLAAAFLWPPSQSPLPIGAVPDLAVSRAADGKDWPSYGGDAGGSRYSPLEQITPENVANLKVAWVHHVASRDGEALSGLEVTPLKIGQRLYLCNGANVIDALDAETGVLLWRFDPGTDLTGITNRICRGVAYHRSDTDGACAERIVTATVDAKLWAVDANDGSRCPDFAGGGAVDLRAGMGEIGPGYYYPTSAPAIIGDNAVVGGWVFDSQKTDSPSGVVRAFNIKTGALAWAWDLGRTEASDTYTRGTPNAWAPMSVDEELGLVYVPTGNAAPDYYGAQRSAESERFSSSVVALDGKTGVVRWSFQTVHHDVWDYDVPAQPTLIDITRGEERVPALLQATKAGQLFVLDRRTGEPIVDVRELPVPRDGAPGERLSPTQPFSTGLPSLAGPLLNEQAMWGLTPVDQLWCRIEFKRARYDGPMTPPQLDRTTINAPGFMGAVSWGGPAFDPARGIIVINSTRIATQHRLLTRAQADAMGLKARGATGFQPVVAHSAQEGTPYATMHRGFLSPLGVPCQQPPYGVLSAIHLDRGAVLWEKPLGTARDTGPLGLTWGPPLTLGTPNTGGPLTTASGLVFIAATQELAFRAIDIATGDILWKVRLPAGGHATPMSYWSETSQRQFVVVAAGGKRMLNTRMGDHIIAYALP
jgi:quinoprotein glucose dehydrogenase